MAPSTATPAAPRANVNEPPDTAPSPGLVPLSMMPVPVPSAHVSFAELPWALIVQVPLSSVFEPVHEIVNPTKEKVSFDGVASVIPPPLVIVTLPPVTTQLPAAGPEAPAAPLSDVPTTRNMPARPTRSFFLLIMQFPPLGCGCLVRAVRWCSHHVVRCAPAGYRQPAHVRPARAAGRRTRSRRWPPRGPARRGCRAGRAAS